MIAELNIEPIGTGSHLSEAVAGVVDLIQRSGLDYQVTAMGTLVEGESEQVWDLLRRCHAMARSRAGRIITGIRIDDRGDEASALHHKVHRVEDILGKELKKTA